MPGVDVGRGSVHSGDDDGNQRAHAQTAKCAQRCNCCIPRRVTATLQPVTDRAFSATSWQESCTFSL